MKIYDIEKLLKDNSIVLPKHYSAQGFFETLLENDSGDYPEALKITKKLLDLELLTIFPNKNKKESIIKYLRRIISENQPVEKVFDPKLDLTFGELYQLSGLHQMMYINERSEFNRVKWDAYKKDRRQYT